MIEDEIDSRIALNPHAPTNAKNPVPPKASRTLLPLKIYSEPKTKSVCMIVEINAVIPAKSAFDNFEVFTKIK